MLPPRPGVTYRYWACDLRTGVKLCELPLKPQGALPERISDVSTVVFSCDQGALQDGADFIGFTTPGKTAVVLEREYDGDNTTDIVWAGIVTNRDAGPEPEATLNCATPMAYYGRRHAGTHTYSEEVPGDTDTKIITDLLADATPEGIGLILDVDCPTLRTVRYLAPERKPVLDCLKDLSDMENGPEFTVITRWSDADRLSIEFVFYARIRMGWAGTPNARFDYPGSIRKYTVHDDYTEGHGANHIIGVEGEAASDPVRDEEALLQGWPRWEETVEKTGDLGPTGLLGIARTALQRRARGQSTVDMAVDLTLGPQYLRDFNLGDNITFFVYGPKNPGDRPPSFRHPAGHQETIRVIGGALDPGADTYTPVLWNPYEETS